MRPLVQSLVLAPGTAVALSVSLAAPGAAGAQGGAVSAQCAAPPYAPNTIPTLAQVRQDACQKALDLFAFMAPQLGTSITGGNAVLGGSGTLGGLGRFSLGLRANVIAGQLPQTRGVQLSVTGAQRADFSPERQVLGLPTVDAAVGLFKGLPIGLTNVGGLDALVSVFYVPDVSEGDFALSTRGGSVKFGYGARLGILQETAVVPGVSLSYLRRDLPTIDFAASVGGGDSVAVAGLKTETSAWRLVAGKRFYIVGVAAGVGRDRYESRARADAFIASRTLGGVLQTPSIRGELATASQTLTRTNFFADVSLNFPIVRLVAGVGRVSGGSVASTYNGFGARSPDDAYTYGSVGLRVQR